MKEQAIKEIVNTFFREYTTQITLAETGKTPEQLEPKQLKQAMLDHYEEVAQHFHRHAFPRIAEVNGMPIEDIPNDITPDMMRTVCQTEPIFNAMVDAYRQNFLSLLQGYLYH